MPSNYAASGMFGNALEAVRHLVASSQTFRNIVGAGSETDAMRYVHAPEASDRDGEEDPMPRAIVGIATFETTNFGSATWSDRGTLDLSFEFVPPSNLTGNRDDCYAWFVTKVGEILTEMRTNSGSANEVTGTGSYLNMRQIQLVEGPGQGVLDEEGGKLFYGVCFSIPWGG